MQKAPPPPPSKPAASSAKPGAPKPAPGKAPAVKKPAVKKVVVFGASGRVGSRFMEEALKRGHLVTAYTRNSLKVKTKHKNLKVQGGNITDDRMLREAISGQDVVVVALGPADMSRAHSLLSEAMKRIVAAMKALGVGRVVALGNIGLMPHPSGKLQGEVKLPPMLEFIFADQRVAYTDLKDSGLDWTLVCPPFMPLGEATGVYRVAVETPLEDTKSISVQDCVQFLVKEVFEEPHPKARVGVGYCVCGGKGCLKCGRLKGINAAPDLD